MRMRNIVCFLVPSLLILLLYCPSISAEPPDVESMAANYQAQMSARRQTITQQQSETTGWLDLYTDAEETPLLSIYESSATSQTIWPALALAERKPDLAEATERPSKAAQDTRAAESDGTEVKAGETGNDPRDFSNKFMPYYRFEKLRNGWEVNSITVFGLHAFTPQFAMTYEMPFARTARIASLATAGSLSQADEFGQGGI